METIILIINARKPSIEAIDFACHISELAGARLTGVFIENIYYQRTKKAISVDYGHYEEDGHTLTVADTEQSIRLFKDQCTKHQINTQTIIDTGEPIQKILLESRYADLLIMEPDLNFYDRDEEQPSTLLRSILIQSECPVMLTGTNYEKTDEIIFCFDGSPSSIYTAKQFSYLFPQLKDIKVTLLEVKNVEEEEFTESHMRMMSWLRTHYDTVYYQLLKGDISDELLAFLLMKQNKIIVMGAYGRSILSNMFHKSEADPLIRAVDLPLFITHY